MYYYCSHIHTHIHTYTYTYHTLTHAYARAKKSGGRARWLDCSWVFFYYWT